MTTHTDTLPQFQHLLEDMLPGHRVDIARDDTGLHAVVAIRTEAAVEFVTRIHTDIPRGRVRQHAGVLLRDYFHEREVHARALVGAIRLAGE